MHLIYHHTVPTFQSPLRLREYARIHLGEYIPSKAGIKKAIKKGEIRINGLLSESQDWIEPGQELQLWDLDEQKPKIYRMVLDVIHEDHHLAVVYKPAGIIVSGNQFKTLENALPYNLTPSQELGALLYPKPVHRLDAPTTGLVLVAKTARARRELSLKFEKKQIKKRYRALVIGQTERWGFIHYPVNEKESLTEFELVRTVPSLKNKTLSLLDLYPHTGRTHQLRQHMAWQGNPILGDQQYGQDGLILSKKGLFLSAVALEFAHPITEEKLTIEVDMPSKFEARLQNEKRRWEKYNPS